MLCHNIMIATNQIHDSDCRKQGWGKLGKCNGESMSQVILAFINF